MKAKIELNAKIYEAELSKRKIFVPKIYFNDLNYYYINVLFD